MERMPLLLVGSYHMANPGLDLVNFQADDPRSARRQPEIQRVVQGLTRFCPTVVALEIPTEYEAEWNQNYRAWREAQFALTADERCQLGFQLAGAMGLDRIAAIDWNGASGYGPRDLGQILEWARAHRPDAYKRLMAPLEKAGAFADAQARSTIGQLLRSSNGPEGLRDDHRWYLEAAQVLCGDDFVGAEWVAGWYRRNLFIFARLAQLAEPGSRLLVLYGSGHIPLLRHFASESGRFALEDPLLYLPE